MAITRSPRYPNISLVEAISRAKAIYSKEHMSPLTPKVAAEAMGYGGINGASLKTISSLKKYGLLEGRGDDVRLTKDAQTLILDEAGTPDYQSAIRRSALSPEVFSEIHKQFQDGGSERNIAVYLEKQGFKPGAAATVARNFKESMALVGGSRAAYTEDSEPPSVEGVPEMQAQRPSYPQPNAAAPSGETPYRIVQNGKRLEIAASVDLAQLRVLKELLETYEKVLVLMEGSASDRIAAKFNDPEYRKGREEHVRRAATATVDDDADVSDLE
jgi:hypothetical protein